MKKCMQMFKQWYLQMMDGGCTKYYRITGIELLMQYKLTIQVSFLVHNLYKNNTLELFYILTTF